jgi:hypothetical protein
LSRISEKPDAITAQVIGIDTQATQKGISIFINVAFFINSDFIPVTGKPIHYWLHRSSAFINKGLHNKNPKPAIW